jgi:hypothetical protein
MQIESENHNDTRGGGGEAAITRQEANVTSISEYLIRFLFCLVSFNPTIGSEQLTRARDDLRRDLDHLNSVLDNLDELGDIMVLMLTTQDSIMSGFRYRSSLSGVQV